ncbi:hypothetical protein EHO61_04545 [Leptospira fluminis]|uniref:Uncharacterized protein n=1 Tax=Leptospira fluminis TaxID=2484979 RepID=A0A4R9GSG0_9LEPT|nr:hypothetical protein [Leptospira fluminis]TGK21128.1 hypothetical protein EHO61_04545 [Leptospira fluminis]
MRISDGIQRVSFPEEALTYVKPVMNRSIVPPVDPVKQRDFSRFDSNLKFYGPEGEALKADPSLKRGSILDLYA